MTTGEMLVTAWHLKPEVVAGSVALVALYLVWVRPLTARALSWVSGVLLLCLILISPLDTLAHDYLFSAHMAQHLLMTLVVPPLLLAGVPPRLLERAMSRALLTRLGSPLPAWLLANGVMWAWHAPPLYGAALASDGLHILQHAMFLGTATLFWWPVVAPASPRPLMPPWALMLYLFAAMAAGSALGILLAFAPAGLYPHYVSGEDHHGLLSLVRDGWGITPADDQQLGGMLMWIPGGIVYGLAVVAALARWLDEPEEREEPAVPATPAPAERRLVLSAAGELREVGPGEESYPDNERKRHGG